MGQPVSGIEVEIFGKESNLYRDPVAMVGQDSDGKPVPLALNADGSLAGTPELIETCTGANVSVSDSSTSVLAANPNRKNAVIVNYGANDVCIARGGTAAFGQGIYLAAGNGYEITAENLYQGAIHAICASGKSTTLAVEEGA